MFPKNIGNVAKSCRMVLGSLIIQMRMGYSDRELVKQIQENLYYQYFVGISAFQQSAPFAPSLLVEWRKRIDVEFIIKANDLLCDSVPKLVSSKHCRPGQNRGTLMATEICDATQDHRKG